jgi:hypothetical protein
MPPSYGDKTFWNARFSTEEYFEWLGDGTRLTACVHEYLEERKLSRGEPNGPPKTLHIGAGTSTLDIQILRVYEDVFPGAKSAVVVNTDFSSQAVANGKNRTRAENATRSAWEMSDILSWTDMESLSRKYSVSEQDRRAFDLVLDKSTSDAISCNDDFIARYKDGPSGLTLMHHCIVELLQRAGTCTVTIEPLQLLALHLATVVRPGGAWIVLSYSSNRFPFLSFSETRNENTLVLPAHQWWRVERVEQVEAPSGQEKEGVFAPTIMHHLYVLRRTDVLC